MKDKTISLDGGRDTTKRKPNAEQKLALSVRIEVAGSFYWVIRIFNRGARTAIRVIGLDNCSREFQSWGQQVVQTMSAKRVGPPLRIQYDGVRWRALRQVVDRRHPEARLPSLVGEFRDKLHALELDLPGRG